MANPLWILTTKTKKSKKNANQDVFYLYFAELYTSLPHCSFANIQPKKQSSNYEITSKRTRFVATYDTLAACFPREIDHLPWEVHWHYLHVKKGDVWNESQLKILQTHIGYIHTQLCINEYVYIKICVYIYISHTAQQDRSMGRLIPSCNPSLIAQIWVCWYKRELLGSQTIISKYCYPVGMENLP